MSRLKTYLVSFCVFDFYSVELPAHSKAAAIAAAQALYDQDGEEPFEFDIAAGGVESWDAQEVAS